MSTDLASLVVRLEAQSAAYDAKLDQATAKLRSFHKSTNDTIKDLAGTIAGLVSLGALANFGEKILENAVTLQRLSEASGVAVEALSKLQFAASQSGVDTDALATGLKKLNIAAAEAATNLDSKAASAFDALGISVKDANGNVKNADTLFSEIAGKLSTYADGANKVALAQAFFGKSGADLIPILNKGAAGLKELGDQAAAAGIVISGETAEAADKFEQKLGLLKAGAQGIGTQLEAVLLPTLSDLADQFIKTAKDGDGIRTLGEEIASGFKLVASVIAGTGDAFSALGRNIGASAAAAVQFLKGNFDEAGAIVHERYADLEKEAKASWDRQTAIWKAGTQAQLDFVTVTAKRIKEQAPALVDPAELAKLTNLRDALQAQLATLDQGQLAATKYKLSHGELAKALAVTGAAGQKAKGDILALTKALEFQESLKALDAINAELLAIAGNSAAATALQLASQNQAALNKFTETGNQQGIAALSQLEQKKVAQAALNDAQAEAVRIQDDLAIAEQRINDAVLAGTKTDLQASAEISAARKQAATDLDAILVREKELAETVGNPATTEGVKKFGAAIDSLKVSTNQFGQQVQKQFEDAFGHNFSDLITGAVSARDAIKGFLKDIEKDFADLIAKNFAQQLFGGLAGAVGSGGSGGGFGGFIASIVGSFAGGHADGGTIPAGHWGTVGEQGPELAYASGSDMHIVPVAKDGGGQRIVQNFHIQAPTGTINRQTQQQIAATAARGIGAANRRNN